VCLCVPLSVPLSHPLSQPLSFLVAYIHGYRTCSCIHSCGSTKQNSHDSAAAARSSSFATWCDRCTLPRRPPSRPPPSHPPALPNVPRSSPSPPPPPPLTPPPPLPSPPPPSPQPPPALRSPLARPPPCAGRHRLLRLENAHPLQPPPALPTARAKRRRARNDRPLVL
jgi:hypothetical protein